ncbi:MAG: YfcC family protein [Firmicutes bacterium]|nr:YfcC family protein [Bacillota bacterium]
MSTGKKWSLKLPNALAILFLVVCVAVVMTWVLPAGQFDRQKDPKSGRMLAVAGTYHLVERNPVSIWGLFVNTFKGMMDAAEIIFFVFIIGGVFQVLKATQAINVGILALLRVMKGREKLIIPLFMVIFSLGGATLGWAEEGLIFIPVFVPLALSLGWDSLTGLAVVMAGMNAGFSGAFTNPFTIGVAHGIAGLPLFSGMQFRLVVWVVLTAVSAWWVYGWARKVEKNPEISPMYELDKQRTGKGFDVESIPGMNSRHVLVLLCFAATMATFVYGILKLDWYFTEMSAIFTALAIVGGYIGGLTTDQICDEFIFGCKELLGGALLVGVGRAVAVTLTQGKVIDTVVFGMASIAYYFPTILRGTAQYIAQAVIEFFIPSGSGQAAATIPIMAPLADVTGISRQTAVLAYQFGDGFTNIFEPTSGYFMAGLALAGVPWPKWVKFFYKLLLIWVAIAVVATIVAVAIGYS